MRGFSTAAAIAATSLFAGKVLADVDPIVIKGSKFFYQTNGTQFYIRGVAYQQDYNANSSTDGTATELYTDPLADVNGCKRDIPYLIQLRTNVIRTYAIDPTKDHDECMKALADAGIYVISDLSDPEDSINRNTPTWNTQLYERYTSVIDALAKYNNTLGFFAGNEVSNSYNTTGSAAFVKASVRDMKKYIKDKGYRALGVGYASDDDQTIRDAQSNYMNCGPADQSIDFWGYNIYEWCGDSSFQQSGYEDRTKAFANYSVPVFFAEYGCNTVQPRTFGDTPALFGSDMNGVWSGGIVYMYFQTPNNYGLVNVDGNSVSPRADFTAYSSQIANVNPTGVQMNSYSPSNSARSCPATNSNWLAAASPLPPTPNQAACDCIWNSLSCVVKSSTTDENYGKLFGSVCGLDKNACAQINTNSSNGNFGAYGMCNSTVQLAIAFNQYYVNQKSVASACDFGGAASTKSATSATGGCSSQLAQASNAVSATGGSGGGSGSGTGAGVSTFSAPTLQNGLWQMTTLVVVACLSGMHSWIDYCGVSKVIEVRISKSGDLKPENSSVSCPVDLSNILWREAIYVGISSSSKSSAQASTVYSWSFAVTQGPPYRMHSEPLDPESVSIRSHEDVPIHVRTSSPWKFVVALFAGAVCGALAASAVFFVRSKVGKRHPVAPVEYPVVHVEGGFEKIVLDGKKTEGNLAK